MKQRSMHPTRVTCGQCPHLSKVRGEEGYKKVRTPKHWHHFHSLFSSQLFEFIICGYCKSMLVHGQVTIVFVVSVGLSVFLFVCAEFFSAVFDPISIKLGHM